MLFTKTLSLATSYGTEAVSRLWLLVSTIPGEIPKEIGAAEIGEGTQKAARSVVQSFNGSWQELADGRSPIFIATVRVSLIFATVLIALWGIPWIKTILEEGYSQKTVDKLIYPLLVVFLLSINNGSLLSNTCLLGRSTINYLDNQVLQVTINNIKIEQVIRQANMNQTLRQMLEAKVAECKLLPSSDSSDRNREASSDKNQEGLDSQSVCIQAAVTQVRQIAQNYQNQQGAFKFDFDLGKIMTSSINSQIQREMQVIFSVLQTGFVFLIEITALLNAYIAPVFLSLSLLPGQSKLIHAWLSGWLGLGLLKVSYTIIIGIAASTVVSSGDTAPLLLPLLQAVLSPILAVIIASGGGVALFTGLGSMAGGSLRFGLRSGGRRRN